MASGERRLPSRVAKPLGAGLAGETRGRKKRNGMGDTADYAARSGAPQPALYPPYGETDARRQSRMQAAVFYGVGSAHCLTLTLPFVSASIFSAIFRFGLRLPLRM